MQRVEANPRNVYPANALRGVPIFPHDAIYRHTIRATLDAAALARLHAGPDIRISLGRRPVWAGPRLALSLGVMAFLAEQPGRNQRVHAVWGRRLGFRRETASVQQCRTPEELTELILHSSCTPPLTPSYRRGVEPVFDGGIYDNVPLETAGLGRETLVLLTRRFPERALPQRPGLTYVQPSEPIPVAKWDYTSPERVERTFAQGRRDGERFAEQARQGHAA